MLNVGNLGYDILHSICTCDLQAPKNGEENTKEKIRKNEKKKGRMKKKRKNEKKKKGKQQDKKRDKNIYIIVPSCGLRSYYNV